MIQNLSLLSRGGSIVESSEAVSGNVSVVGNPLHVNSQELRDTYKQQSLSEFLSYESRHSAGNYVVVDDTDNSVRLITSPAYATGYVADTPEGLAIATTLSSVFEYIQYEDVSVDGDALLHKLDEQFSHHDALTTPFTGVKKLPAGYVYECESETGSGHSYVAKKALNRGPETLESYFQELAMLMRGENPTLALSGHADSSALAVALWANDIDFEVLTFDLGPGSSHPVEARWVTDRLGMELSVLEVERPIQASDRVKQVEEYLRTDLVNPRSPYFAMEQQYSLGENIVLTGLNFGAAHASLMRDPKPLYRREDQSLVDRAKRAAKLYINAGHNFPYTRAYTESKLARDVFWAVAPVLDRVIKRKYKGTNSKFISSTDRTDETSFEGILRGMIDVRFPNICPSSFDSLSSWAGIDLPKTRQSDVSKITEQFLSDVSNIQRQSTVDLAEYYSHFQTSAKHTGTFPTGSGRVEIPANWGPSLSFYIGRERSLRQSVKPKQELYEYIADHMGISLWELRSGGVPAADRAWPKEAPLLKQNNQHFRPENSALLKLLEGSPTHSSVTALYEQCLETARKNRYEDMNEAKMLHRVLNFELVVKSNFSH